METAAPAESRPGEENLYQQGLTHMQSAEWQEAIACFEELLRRQPRNSAAREALEAARFKARLDAGGRVRARRWIIPWRSIFIRAAIGLAILVLALVGRRLIQSQVVPLLAEWREQQRLAGMERQAAAAEGSGDFVLAQTRYGALLTAVPDHPGALEGLVRIEAERVDQVAYEAAVKIQDDGDCETAIQRFTELQIQRPGYRDVSQRIEECKRVLRLAEVFDGAEADFAAGRYADALVKYDQLRQLDLRYEEALVQDRRFEAHMRQGRALLEARPATVAYVMDALSHFEEARAVRPTDPDAAQEQQLAKDFVEGEERYQAGEWDVAISLLRAVYDQRPSYLGGVLASMLYQAYIHYGDQQKDAESPDCALAYQQYTLAAGLPVDDRTLAERRKLDVLPCIPPTPTPTDTPTPTAIPSATPVPEPSRTPRPTPTPTPWAVGSLYNQIIFKQAAGTYSDAVAEVWAMNPDGSNRRRLGPFTEYVDQYKALKAEYSRSPDGRFRAYTNGRNQIAIELPPSPDYAPGSAKQITQFTGICYDPAWSPDGGRIVFVSAENESDDIWVMSADGTNPRWLTRGTWEWDKHPTWSPDSQRIAFWSNRNGLAQIYVMWADGHGVQENISQSQFNEWDPLWIRR